jgi:hypothetical protein
MTVTTMTLRMSSLLALPEPDLIRKGLLALAEKEIRLSEEEIVRIRERYDVFSKEALYQAIEDGRVAGHPAWEDYIVWKNKEAHIGQLRDLAERG